jgi:hypothetical protein
VLGCADIVEQNLRNKVKSVWRMVSNELRLSWHLYDVIHLIELRVTLWMGGVRLAMLRSQPNLAGKILPKENEAMLGLAASGDMSD